MQQERRVRSAGIVKRRCASCGEIGSMSLVETTEPSQRVGLVKREPGSVFISAHCSACGRVYPARESDVDEARRQREQQEQ